MRERLTRRWSVRTKAALGAMAAAAVAFGLGVFWARESVGARWADEAEKRATQDAFQVVSALEAGRQPIGFDSPFVVVLADGRLGGGMDAASGPSPERAWPGFAPTVGWSTRKLRPPAAEGDERPLRTFVVGTTDVLPPDRIRRLTGLDGVRTAQRLTVYALASPRGAEAAVATFDRVLGLGLPAAVAFVGLTAWLVTGRALRPVEAIRAEMAGITAGALDQRVPVPPSADVIARLARTTNATLERLEQAHVRQRRFVADASHELRSPLAALRGTLEIPLARPERADWPAVVSAALADTARLQRLTDDLLLLSSEGGRPPRSGAAVDLADIVEEQVAERAYARGAPAFTCDAERPALVPGDEVRLGRVVRNLLDNAARHARSAVHATVRPEAGAVVLTVADDGPGVPAADRERIFDRFVRLDEARTRADGGTGLGLTIVRELVTALGGTVHVTGRSTFTVRIPALGPG